MVAILAHESHLRSRFQLWAWAAVSVPLVEEWLKPCCGAAVFGACFHAFLVVMVQLYLCVSTHGLHWEQFLSNDWSPCRNGHKKGVSFKAETKKERQEGVCVLRHTQLVDEVQLRKGITKNETMIKCSPSA